MSLDDLAEASEVSRRMLSYIEAGRTSPTAGKLHAIAHALGVPVGRLIQAGCVDGFPASDPGPDGMSAL